MQLGSQWTGRRITTTRWTGPAFRIGDVTVETRMQ